jgi:hypothetical protein
MSGNDKTYREGRRRLKEMPGRAKAEARNPKSEHAMQAHSMLGKSVMNRIKVRNFEALIVYEDGPGKWYGDLVLKGMPPGVPNSLGTATSTPRFSAKEATNDCYMILVGLLRGMHERDKAARDKTLEDIRVFEIHGMEFSVPGEAVDVTHALSEMTVGADYSADDALEFVGRVVDDICGGKDLTKEVLESTSEELNKKLMTAMSLALMRGEFHYPRRKISSPDAKNGRRRNSDAH